MYKCMAHLIVYSHINLRQTSHKLLLLLLSLLLFLLFIYLFTYLFTFWTLKTKQNNSALLNASRTSPFLVKRCTLTDSNIIAFWTEIIGRHRLFSSYLINGRLKNTLVLFRGRGNHGRWSKIKTIWYISRGSSLLFSRSFTGTDEEVRQQHNSNRCKICRLGVKDTGTVTIRSNLVSNDRWPKPGGMYGHWFCKFSFVVCCCREWPSSPRKRILPFSSISLVNCMYLRVRSLLRCSWKSSISTLLIQRWMCRQRSVTKYFNYSSRISS